MTSHAAVVARGMGKPCVAGCEALSIDERAKDAHLAAAHELHEGDMITIDGGTGAVIVGEVPLVPPQINDDFSRRSSVGRDDYPPSERARERRHAGGCGQGPRVRRPGNRPLPDRAHVHGRGPAPVVREMILADDEDGRRAALDRLLPMQQADFEGIFEAMAGLPVTIRLLDPPLHEFLPALEEATDERMRERIRPLHESNPMLGTRGCRLGLQWPGDLRDAGARDRPRRHRRRASAPAARRSSRSCTRSWASRRSCTGCGS